MYLYKKMEESYVIGTCQKMCPTKEAKLRQKENLLHKFEMKSGTECNRRPEYDPGKVVKSFSRSAAGIETADPSNLRPFPVLLKTIEYLYLKIFPMQKEKPVIVYNFMFDRFRAVRQDAVIQNLPPVEMIKILEPIVKFLIYFSYILSEEDISEFDPHINNTHIQECLKRLLVCYNESDGISQPNRWEIESAYLLFNLGNIKALTRGISLCESQRDENYFYSLKLSLQWYLRNYFKVFSMILNLPPLLLCVVYNSLPEIRKYTFQALCFTYSCANSAYPVWKLRSLLLYETDTHVVDDCKCFKVRVSDGNVNFLKKEFDSSAQCKFRRLKWFDKELEKCDVAELLYLKNR